MYRCFECGHIFDDGEQRITEKNENVCPICDSQNIEKVSPCRICSSYAVDKGERYCGRCKRYVNARFGVIMRDRFTEEERNLLNELYQDKRF